MFRDFLQEVRLLADTCRRDSRVLEDRFQFGDSEPITEMIVTRDGYPKFAGTHKGLAMVTKVSGVGGSWLGHREESK